MNDVLCAKCNLWTKPEKMNGKLCTDCAGPKEKVTIFNVLTSLGKLVGTVTNMRFIRNGSQGEVWGTLTCTDGSIREELFITMYPASDRGYIDAHLADIFMACVRE